MASSSTSLLFSPLPSTSFLHKNPNLSSSSSLTSNSLLLCNFSPTSISISINTNTNNKRRTTFCVSLSAVGFPFPAETSAPSAGASRGRGGGSGSGNGSGSGSKSGSSGNLSIAELGISDEIVSALSRRGITQLFPIQRAVLEPAMEGRDMIGRAITGSGKTLAFGIPILDKIIQNRGPRRQRRSPTALVLAPTRELARQVQKEFKESAPMLGSVCLYGGVPISSQVRALGMGVDIAVGTPGRIIDLVERGALDLSEVKFVVLDEADQMLAVGFQEDVECILKYLPEKRQCMLFSATMPSWVNELSRKYLRNPLVIDLVGDSDQKLADGISLYSVVSTSYGKENILPTLISKYGQGGKSIIFTRTKKDAEELSRSMGGTLASKALHGNMQQFQRDRTLAAFRDGRFSVLVATDVAARGLDIPNVDLVIHFEIPNTSEIFVHRSGRTGRAGKKGTAVLMYTKAQRRAVTTIERDLGCKFTELPSIAGSTGGRMGGMDADERGYGTGRYGDSGMSRRQYPDRSGERQFGSYSGSSGNTYGTRTNRSSERQFGSYSGSRGDTYGTRSQPSNGRSGSSNYSRLSDQLSIPFAKSRGSQLNKYNDFESNQSPSGDKKREEGFKQILEMLKEQT